MDAENESHIDFRRHMDIQCFPFDAFDHRKHIAHAALGNLTEEQLAATARFFLWSNNSDHSEQEFWLRGQNLFGGDRHFAAMIATALLATKHAPLEAANDEAPLPTTRLQLISGDEKPDTCTIGRPEC